MVKCIRDFSDTYNSGTGRYPVIYTTTDWWKACTGNSPAFGSTNALWISPFCSVPGPLTNGWAQYIFW